jgi:predicted TIM-barrel fold metal-dependent hydrolase
VRDRRDDPVHDVARSAGHCRRLCGRRVGQSANDNIYRTFVEPYRERFAFFACVPLQDPHAAAEELQRGFSELAAMGALVNGYTNVVGKDTARSLDEPLSAGSLAKAANRAPKRAVLFYGTDDPLAQTAIERLILRQ